ncbi:hypothetical protein [Chryseobacterium sp. GP-SGM7]|uniref:hypothetical protein n=1 Tax=Chryseobacterium sp. GP-SGM7 TaxID=3411323 RepID=UPI003B93C366
MKKTLILFFIVFTPLFFFSQKKNPDTIYIQFDYTKDRHHEKKNEINFFEICIDNKRYVHFQYGTSKTKTIKSFDNKVMNRTNLSAFIKNDSGEKNVKYIIVKKLKNNYNLYDADHIFRTIRD